MMNKENDTNYKKRNILAVAGGLFLVALICGCGREENIILIGTSGEQEMETVSEVYEDAAILQKRQSEFPQGQSKLQHERAAVWHGQSELPQEQEGQIVSNGQNAWPEGQISTFGQQTPSGQGAEAKDETLMRIYVCGAVVNPGVVSVPEGSRVEDALLQAGGFTSEALRHALNLADWVYDGQMLYFPAEGENMDTLTAGGWPEYGFGGGQGLGAGRNQSVGTGQNQVSELVNINTADVAALVTLPGIGESRAQDIIAYREKNGSFANCEDIMNVSGIKTSVYEKICDRITVK